MDMLLGILNVRRPYRSGSVTAVAK